MLTKRRKPMQKRSPIHMSNPIAGTPGTTPPRILIFIPGVLAFILYFVTCSPTINFTDSGELATVAWTGGIAHPPGYPLYTLFGIAFIHLPFGEPAWRMSMISALFGAAAVSLFYALVTDTLLRMHVGSGALAQSAGRPRTSATSASKASPPGKTVRTTSASRGSASATSPRFR